MAVHGGPLALEMLREIGGDEQATQKFLRVLNRDVPPSALFTPRLLARAGAHAARRRPGQLPAMLREAGVALRDQVRRERARPAYSGS